MIDPQVSYVVLAIVSAPYIEAIYAEISAAAILQYLFSDFPYDRR
jgi:hypothetical protein